MQTDGKISFPKQQCWNPLTRVATIAADVDGKRVSCRISAADLQKKFESVPDAPMLVITANRTQIENAARILIQNKAFEADGSIVIGYKDL